MTQFKQKQWELDLHSMLMELYNQSSNVDRFANIEDKVYEAMKSSAKAKAEENGVCGDEVKQHNFDRNGLPKNIKSPSLLMLTNVITLSAYLASIFAFKQGVFTITHDPANMLITRAVRDKTVRDASNHGWALQLLKTCYNATIFNFAPIHQYVDRRTSSIRFEALCPYNTGVDSAVPPENLDKDGSFMYTVRMKSMAKLYEFLSNTREEFLTSAGVKIRENVLNVVDVAKMAGSGGVEYVTGSGVYDLINKVSSGTGTDWNLFGTEHEFKKRKGKRRFIDGASLAVGTFWLRAAPEWLNLPPQTYGSTDTKNPAPIPVWEVTTVGSLIVAVKPLETNPHLIPAALGSVRVSTGSGSAYSFAEMVAPSQDYATKLDNARLQALRRSFGRHGVYNPTAISEEELNKPLAAMKNNPRDLDDKKLTANDAFSPSTFDGSAVAELIGTLAEVPAAAARMLGNTPQMQGSRIPGNKRPGEAAKEMSAAEAPFRTYAMVFQETCVAPMRKLLKLNYAAVLADIRYTEPASGELLAVTPEEYNAASIKYEVSDGLTPSAKTLTPEAVSAMITLVTQSQALQTKKDIGVLADVFASALGFDNFSDIPSADLAQRQFVERAQRVQGDSQSPSTTPSNPQNPNPAGTAQQQQAAQQQPPAPTNG